MNIDYLIILGLVVYSLVREVFFLYSTNKLINKLMSKNYDEYTHVENKNKNVDFKADNLSNETGLREDLGIFAGIG